MKYRSRTDNIAQILTAAMQGVTKTRIMYASYLSYAQLQEYLTFLQEKGLILYEVGTQKYTLTEKGLHYIHVYETISELVSVPKTPVAVEPAQSVSHQLQSTNAP